jgi:tetratricopeptide (TPR) repeat protein
VYLRDYDGSRKHFFKLDNQFPGTGIKPVTDVVIWQAIMLENWDFRYDAEYRAANSEAQTALTRALAVPGNEGWEHFLMAGTLGIEAIHVVRLEKYLSALQIALDAMTHAGQAREAAPEFTDLLLADGMYNYWRTVVTENSKVLPQFADKRVEGIEQMKVVEREGIFLTAPARLSLSFSYVEEHDDRSALAELLENKRLYPDNIINLLVLGQVLSSMRRFDDALATYDHIRAVDPTNQRALYWKGVTLLNAGRSAEALEPLTQYLASDYLETWHRSWTHYRLGQVHYRQKRYAEAEASYRAAIEIDGHKSAKAALERLLENKKSGRISY